MASDPTSSAELDAAKESIRTEVMYQAEGYLASRVAEIQAQLEDNYTNRFATLEAETAIRLAASEAQATQATIRLAALEAQTPATIRLAVSEARGSFSSNKEMKLPHPKAGYAPIYHGEHLNMEAEGWIFDMHEYFTLTGVGNTAAEEDFKLQYAAGQLKGEAKLWWRRNKLRMDGAQPFTSFDALCDGLMKRFQPINSVVVARDRIASLKQTSSVVKYVDAFNALQLQIPDMNHSEAFDRFTRGLKPDLQKWINVHDVTELEEAISLAHKMEQLDSPHVQIRKPSHFEDPMDLSAISADSGSSSKNNGGQSGGPGGDWT